MIQIAHGLAQALELELPEILVISTSFDDMSLPSVADSPVLSISENTLGAVRLSLHVDECDALEAIAGRVQRAARHCARQQDATLDFRRSEAILDSSDFRIGVHLHFAATFRQMAA